MCCHLGFVLPFIEHRQSRLSIILRGPRIFRMVSTGVNLKWPAALAPNGRVSPSLQALKPGIYSPPWKPHLPVRGCFVCVEHPSLSAAAVVNDPPTSGWLAAAPALALAASPLTLRLWCYGDDFFPETSWTNLCWLQIFLTRLPHLSQPSQRALLRIRLWPQGHCCRWVISYPDQ